MFAFHQLHVEIRYVNCLQSEYEMRAALYERQPEISREVCRGRGERVMALFMIIDILRQTYSGG